MCMCVSVFVCVCLKAPISYIPNPRVDWTVGIGADGLEFKDRGRVKDIFPLVIFLAFRESTFSF